MKITKLNTNAILRLEVRDALLATFAAACLGLMAAVSQAATVAPDVEPAKKIVQYGDLNLSNATAVQRLYQRIVSAARHVCDDRTGPRPIEDQARTRICIAQSVERAVMAVNHPALTMLYGEKTGRTTPPTSVLANRH